MNPIPPDEHLLKALRHAPDAEVVPPHEVSARILAAAHRSAAEQPAAAATAAWRRWAAALWHRPGASAALASVLLAGFIGLLWRGEVPGPASEERSIQPAPAAAALRSTKSMATPVPAVTADESPSVLPAAAPRPAPANAVVSRKASAAPPANAPRRAAGNATPELGPLLQTQPAEIAPVQPDPPAAPESPAKAELRSRPAQTTAAPVAAAIGAAADAAQVPPWQASTLAGDHWRWLPEGELRDPDATWWAALARVTQGRWQVAAVAQPAAGSLRLEGQRGPDRVGRLWLEPAAVLWCGASPPCQRAPLPAASRRELLDRLAR